MNIQEVISKAIKGGWLPKLREGNKFSSVEKIEDGVLFYRVIESPKYPETLFNMRVEGIVLDPSFWQSLGKAMGWPTFNKFEKDKVEYSWKNHWHRLVSHLAEGGTIETYFNGL